MTTKYEKHGRKYYEKNKALCLERNRATRARWRVQWWEFKASLACTQCGENHPATLDFHHPDREQKEHNVHRLAANGQYKRAKEEAAKCIVLCANCHRKHHYEEHKKRGAEAPRSSSNAIN